MIIRKVLGCLLEKNRECIGKNFWKVLCMKNFPLWDKGDHWRHSARQLWPPSTWFTAFPTLHLLYFAVQSCSNWKFCATTPKSATRKVHIWHFPPFVRHISTGVQSLPYLEDSIFQDGVHISCCFSRRKEKNAILQCNSAEYCTSISSLKCRLTLWIWHPIFWCLFGSLHSA